MIFYVGKIYFLVPWMRHGKLQKLTPLKYTNGMDGKYTNPMDGMGHDLVWFRSLPRMLPSWQRGQYIVAAGKPFVVGWLDNFMGLDPFTETGFFAQGCFDSFRFVSNDL